jgi:hypothetical protein
MPTRASLQPFDDKDLEDWISLWEAAEQAGVTFDRISRAVIDGELPCALRTGGPYGRDCVHIRDVDAWCLAYRRQDDLSVEP